MSQLASGWYADPSGRHLYRYWDGSRWSNQISDGKASAIDPIDLDEIAQATPPAPGPQAEVTKSSFPVDMPSPDSEVIQRDGGSGPAGVLGVLVGAFIVVVVLVFIFNNGADDSPSSTDAPAASVTTEGSSEAPPTTAP